MRDKQHPRTTRATGTWYLATGTFAAAALAALLLAAVVSARQARDAAWPAHGGQGNIRYSPLTQINRSNVGRLQVAWTYDSRDSFRGSEMQSNPVVIDGSLYITTPTLNVDKLTGELLWETVLPFAGSATPSTYTINGRQYVVIVAGGGKNDAPSGSSVVAFALPY